MRMNWSGAALLMAAPLLWAAPASAETKSADAPLPQVAALVVYGNDPCPRSNDGEIVVCARQPESERYRIPKDLRKKKHDAPAESWTARARMLDTVGTDGTPMSCSPVGASGNMGCYHQFLERARQEREAAKAAEAEQP